MSNESGVCCVNMMELWVSALEEVCVRFSLDNLKSKGKGTLGPLASFPRPRPFLSFVQQRRHIIFHAARPERVGMIKRQGRCQKPTAEQSRKSQYRFARGQLFR